MAANDPRCSVCHGVTVMGAVAVLRRTAMVRLTTGAVGHIGGNIMDLIAIMPG